MAGELTPDQWQRLEALFAAAADLSAGERRALIDREAATDAMVARALDGMLAHAPAAAARIGRAIEGVATAALAANHWAGRRVGPYRIVREIGRGGMGVVFEAVREDEYHQTVALKIAPWAQDVEAVGERFRLERQILAALEHPRIARLLDGGAVDGLPYFVMELVKGQPITQYCAARGLDLRDRLRLVREVAAAVHFAHERLIVHRDLKPANILVGEDGEPKLVDFGIAKIIDPRIDSTTTTPALAMWTPDYTSPEQVRGLPITIRTDVYSLGLVLYELVTGARAQAADTSSPRALEQSICDVDPPRPSACAASRGDRALARRLRGDLDTIVLTTIHKDPEQRYGSMAALVDDLDRHLDGRPVLSRPTTFLYRAGKFVRRHRVGVTAAALIAASGAAGLGATLYQAGRAERRFQQLRTLANTFVFDVHDRIEALPGSTEARRAIVETALTYLENLRTDASADPALAREIAAAYEKVGDVQGSPLKSNLGDTSGALASFDRAIEILEPLAARDDPDASRQLASVLRQRATVGRARGDETWTADLARARDAADELVARAPSDPRALELAGDIHANFARSLYELRELAGAESSALRAMELAERLVALDPSNRSHRLGVSTAHSALGRTRLAQGRLEEAAASYRRAIAIREALVREEPTNADFRRDLLVSYGILGDVLGFRTDENLGDRDGATAAFLRAIELGEWARDHDPSDRRAMFDLSSARLRLGTMLLEEPSRPREALRELEDAERLVAALLQQEPTSDRYGYVAMVIHRRLGDARHALRQFGEARWRFETVRSRSAAFLDGPNGPSAWTQHVLAGIALAAVAVDAGDPRAADRADAAAAELSKRSLGPIDRSAYADLGRVYLALARRAAPDARAALFHTAADHLQRSLERWRAAKLPAAVEPQRANAVSALEADVAECRRATL